MEANVALPAALIGDPVRAALLMALMDGRAHPAGDLARGVGVTAQAASNHLSRLRDGGLVLMQQEGRHRYYRLAGREVAEALESLQRLVPPPRPALEAPRSRPARQIRDARSCYDHLAGRLGVAVAEALAARGLIAADPVDDRRYRLTAAGEAWFRDFGVDTTPTAGRRVFARACLDWTERRPHLAGALGARLLTRLLGLGWVARVEGGRGLRLTLAGSQGLKRALAVELEPLVETKQSLASKPSPRLGGERVG
ncbi:MAG: winged helix-turn-helix transcriptional regulator [Proteobacteria bacterium]|nr:winged helix-turn-helix transcriptional regulator [Pseudomonadota bacterium]